MMMATLGLDDSIFAILAICCGIFIMVYTITSKKIHEELRKPFVAMLVATTVGILVYASQSIPFIVMINLLIIVNALQGTKPVWGQEVVTDNNAQSTSPTTNSLTARSMTVTVAVLLIGLALGYYFVGPVKLAAMAHGSPTPAPTTSQTAPVVAHVVNTAPAAEIEPSSSVIATPIATVMTSTESQQTALAQYQQAKIEHDASTHTLEAAWLHLSQVSNKTAMASWKNGQALWTKSKHDTCGKKDSLKDKDLAELSVIALVSETKFLQCERDANLNRATYLTNNAYTVSEEKGHIDDDIGNLISKLNQK